MAATKGPTVGDLLRDGWLRPMGVTIGQLAAHALIAPAELQAVIDGTRPVTAKLAVRLGAALNITPESLLAQQAAQDLARTRRPRIDPIWGGPFKRRRKR